MPEELELMGVELVWEAVTAGGGPVNRGGPDQLLDPDHPLNTLGGPLAIGVVVYKAPSGRLYDGHEEAVISIQVLKS